MMGGNLDMIPTAAGWALPDLDGAVLLLEAIEMGLGHVGRQLTMLMNSGRLKGVKGVAVGRLVKCSALH